MQLLEMYVTKTKLLHTAQLRIPAGLQGATVALRFSPEWAQLTKTAVFRAGEVTKDVAHVGQTVVIPAECTREKGVALELGIYGTNGENSVAIPTLWTVLGTVCDGAEPSGDVSTDPSLPVWAQVLEMVRQLQEQGVTQNQVEQAVKDFFGGEPAATQAFVRAYAAPAGYGLGSTTNHMPSITKEQADTTTAAGWYEYYNSDVPLCGYPGTQYGGLLVIPSMWSVTQFFFCRQYYGCYLKRVYTEGAWSVWEWVNPPTISGTEYRTTERFNGLPVYVRALTVTLTVPANAVGEFAHGISGFKYLVRCEGRTGATPLPRVTAGGSLAIYAVNATNVSIVTANEALSNKQVLVLLYYTRD